MATQPVRNSVGTQAGRQVDTSADRPVGTPVEETARVLHEIGAEVAKIPEVVNYQAYAGTASPINFNGLVRQYYLRASPELGDVQVNLVDKHQRSRKSHEIAISVRAAIEAIGRKAGGVAKVVEVPPGPPVMSPIVAEIYGPEYKEQIAVAKGDTSAPKSATVTKKTAPPASSALRDTGDSALGRDNATTISSRKKAQKLPSVLAS